MSTGKKVFVPNMLFIGLAHAEVLGSPTIKPIRCHDRLTNRWTPAKTNTVYRYDAVGNLTNTDYAVSTDIELSYDALNRPTNMVDAVGTTRFTYNVNGLLDSEDGPWADDTVSYGYNTGRLRSSLTLQQPNASAWIQSYLYRAIGAIGVR